jgi:hypothetical protein
LSKLIRVLIIRLHFETETFRNALTQGEEEKGERGRGEEGWGDVYQSGLSGDGEVT